MRRRRTPAPASSPSAGAPGGRSWRRRSGRRPGTIAPPTSSSRRWAPSEAWQDALGLVRPGGTVVFFGGREVAIDTFRLHYEELTLRGAFHHTPRTVRAALAFLASGAYPWDRLVTHRVGLEQVAALFADPPPDLLKAAVVP